MARMMGLPGMTQERRDQIARRSEIGSGVVDLDSGPQAMDGGGICPFVTEKLPFTLIAGRGDHGIGALVMARVSSAIRLCGDWPLRDQRSHPACRWPASVPCR